MPDPFKFELVSPARLVVSGDVEQVLVPGSEGDFTVLAYHAPVLTTLRPGVVDIVTAGGESVRYFVRGGFAEVGPAGLTILAETAVDLAEMDASDLVQSIENAEEDVQDAKDDLARDRAQTKLDQLRQVQGALNL
ncbi:MAG: F0F1 ATP synthase subunit epsilon [Methyloceanibacter sp.]|uniref:F0F1 ATP synthase subunit epsilon n=1 Tax=Methyloceanibacter sp. TaxID=1965321 RepID=UPI003D9BAF08